MDRGQILLVGLPLFLLCSDLLTLFVPPPPQALYSLASPHRHHHQQQASNPDPLEFPSQKPSAVGGAGLGSSIHIDFCSSCSYSVEDHSATSLVLFCAYQQVWNHRFILASWQCGQSMLQSSGAFEVYCIGEPVFSKLKEDWFPGEIEVKDLVGRKLATS